MFHSLALISLKEVWRALTGGDSRYNRDHSFFQRRSCSAFEEFSLAFFSILGKEIMR